MIVLIYTVQIKLTTFVTNWMLLKFKLVAAWHCQNCDCILQKAHILVNIVQMF